MPDGYIVNARVRHAPKHSSELSWLMLFNSYVISHCRTEGEAQHVLDAVLYACELLHPERRLQR